MKSTWFFAALIVFAGAGIATAQSLPPQGGFPVNFSGVTQDYKTVPLIDSDTVFVPIDIHWEGPPTGGALPHWAGVRMKMHVLDAAEVDVDQVVNPNGILNGLGGPVSTIRNPFGNRSENQQSVPIFFTVLDPNWRNSGRTLQGSQNVQVFELALHAKNTTPLNNSDVDLTLMFQNIYHVRESEVGSTNITIMPSWYVFVNSQIDNFTQLHQVNSTYLFPTDPLNTETGHWLHYMGTEPAIFHNDGVGSALYATNGGGTATIGIEHVPEPAAGLLAVLGGGALFFSARARSKRRRAV